MEVREFKVKCLLHEHQLCFDDQNNYNNAKTTLKQFCLTLWTAGIGFSFHYKKPALFILNLSILLMFWLLSIIKDSGQSQNYARLVKVEEYLNNIYNYSEDDMRKIMTPKHHEKDFYILNYKKKIKIILSACLKINPTSIFFFSLIVINLIALFLYKYIQINKK